MIQLHCMAGKKVALFGLGGSGIVTAKALVAGGAHVYAWDDNPDSVERAANDGVNTVDLRALNWADIDSFVLSPGVPLTHPQPHWSAELASAAGVEIIGDVELFCRQRRASGKNSKLIAITGTNGKSTTTALVTHLLKSAGRDVEMGGNIGVPVLQLAEPCDEKIYVIECSSYQIDLAPTLDADVAILLNLSPDHLDRHGTMENYAAIKQRLVQKAKQAIVGVDDAWSRAIADQINNVLPIEVKSGAKMLDLSQAPSLRGEHNLQNALAATAAGRCVGLTIDEMSDALKTFGGLAHRMQIVGDWQGVKFINDSKATNADAAAKSLSSFKDIYWIAGGLAKKGGIDDLRPLFRNITKAYLIGDAAPEFASRLSDRVPYEISATLDVAVAHAARDAAKSVRAARDASLSLSKEPVVLLAPAAASFDQFQNFEKRGDAFVAAVKELSSSSGENS
ncbi:MAG: UDP-N-acetylmuramoyl-L-alanine--D-glutamate ligase [Ahrensia sp.]|nr:UDP-N-acetylmuramoyl-L-alanine--D-glutamate ligase [Ahrensia sp.]